MDILAAYPTKYLKAADLSGGPRLATVKSITIEKLGDEQKPVLYFQEGSKGVVLNKTNSTILANSLGRDTDSWLGKQIELHVEPTQFQGRIVDSIRVRMPAAPAQPMAQAEPVEPLQQSEAATVSSNPAAAPPVADAVEW